MQAASLRSQRSYPLCCLFLFTACRGRYDPMSPWFGDLLIPIVSYQLLLSGVVIGKDPDAGKD